MRQLVTSQVEGEVLNVKVKEFLETKEKRMMHGVVIGITLAVVASGTPSARPTFGGTLGSYLGEVAGLSIGGVAGLAASTAVSPGNLYFAVVGTATFGTAGENFGGKVGACVGEHPSAVVKAPAKSLASTLRAIPSSLTSWAISLFGR